MMLVERGIQKSCDHKYGSLGTNLGGVMSPAWLDASTIKAYIYVNRKYSYMYIFIHNSWVVDEAKEGDLITFFVFLHITNVSA